MKAKSWTDEQIKTLYYRHKIKRPFKEFKEWFVKQKKCCYCGLTEPQIAQLISKKKLTTKRINIRGKRLELEHKNPKVRNDDFKNLALACYWCNNAKTDTFTADEFKIIGRAIKKIWKARLSKAT